ncbi:uncharacterized protein LOC124147819 isoform X9 [Haliotis rufescens]|uniref:uncharacterized protein LOC124147819 isoform X9 n=1 Tax=Haliotis rufescens TaxID=6454 RepID=UPI00201EFEF7|nr:uncharacterized protein LOC124147819 isoform X9 [Haliotis rufescens]
MEAPHPPPRKFGTQPSAGKFAHGPDKPFSDVVEKGMSESNGFAEVWSDAGTGVYHWILRLLDSLVEKIGVPELNGFVKKTNPPIWAASDLQHRQQNQQNPVAEHRRSIPSET